MPLYPFFVFLVFPINNPFFLIMDFVYTALIIIRLIHYMAITFTQLYKSAAPDMIQKRIPEFAVICPVGTAYNRVIILRPPVNPMA